MRKVCIAFLMLAVLLVGQFSVFATPDTIALDALGNANDLVAVIAACRRHNRPCRGVHCHQCDREIDW